MDSRDIAKLACRLLALYFAIVTLTSLAWIVPSLSGAEEVLLLTTSYAANTLIYLGIVVVLWRYAGRIALWLVPDPSDVSLGGLSFRMVQRLAFSVVGLVFAVQGAAELLQFVAYRLSAPEGVTGNWIQPINAATKLILGGGLLIGTDNLMRLLGRLEQDRIPQSEAETES